MYALCLIFLIIHAFLYLYLDCHTAIALKETFAVFIHRKYYIYFTLKEPQIFSFN